MGKTEKLRKYRKCWETEKWAKGWLKEADPDANKIGEAFCKICRSFLRPHLTDLQRHEKMKNLNSQQFNQDVLSNSIIITNEQKELDLKLSLYVATHTSIKIIDHLGEILKVMGKKNNSLLSNLKIHRTKCSTLIKNVISPSLLEELILDIGTTPYSLIVDESTDVSKKAIREEFLGFIELHAMDAVNIASAIDNFIQNEGLDGTKLVGQDYDGCATMAGKINGVQ
ncbi:uncharacterized protein LOC126553133 [Aphis gossypii]|uniref:uncharacterized protein LOC126553133 n=1 Tax=Aphis gossypii TaxID=80765 RepID=UPI002159A2D7|nr:uncharacterized protein LOC126553133 [Aphis gossypii]